MVLLTLAPVPRQQFSDQNGVPLPGALIEFFASGTSTHLTAYSDSAGSVALSNPAACDAGGYLTYYLLSSAYKITVSTSAGVLLYTVDPVSAVPVTQVALDVEGTAGEALSANDAVYLSAGDGGRTNGRWYKTDATNAYSSTTATSLGIVPNAIASGVSGTIRQAGRVTGFGGLTSGSLYYLSGTTPGAITLTPPANARALGTADSATSLILSSFIPIPPASGTVAGIVSLGAQTLGTGTKTVSGLISLSTPMFNPGTSSTTTATASGVVFTDSTSRANGTTVETDLSSTTLKANALSANGKMLRITGVIHLATNGNTKTYKVYYGATAVTSFASVLSNIEVKVEILLMRTGASAEDVLSVTLFSGGNNPSITKTTFATDTTADQTVKSTGQSSAASSDVVQSQFVVEVLG